MAANRLGLVDAALSSLERARALGVEHAALDFEFGWALLRLGRYGQAIEALERFEAESPGVGQTAEFLGRSWFHLDDLDRAEAAFGEAVRRDPELAPSVDVYLALIRARRGEPAQAARLLDEVPPSVLDKKFRDRLARGLGIVKPWTIGFAISGGYNSNVVTLGDEVPLPADIASRDSNFMRAEFEARRRFDPGGDDSITLGYSLDGEWYLGRLEAFDLAANEASLRYAHRFGADTSGAVDFTMQHVFLGGDDFRTSGYVRTAIAHRFNQWLAVVAAYRFAGADYLAGAPAVRDRDGVSHAGSLDTYLRSPGTKIRLRAGYSLRLQETDGSDFDALSHGFVLGAAAPLVAGISGEVYYALSLDDYDNANSLAGAGGFAFARDDTVHGAGLRLKRPLAAHLELFLRYDYTRLESNIGVFDYDQHAISAGLAMRF